MVAIGGDEDEQRRLDLHQALDHREAVEARHLDVEEDEIRLVGLDRADRLAAVRAGVDDLDILVRLEAELQPLDGERFVIDQDGADGHFGSSVFDLIGNVDENAEAPLVVRLCLEAMVVAIGLRQTVPNVRQSDAGRWLRRT